MPAMLPDGTTTNRSVSDAVNQRDIQLGRDAEGNVTTDIGTEDSIETERQLEAGARGGDEL
jgi:hypothetical protein